MAGRNPLAPSFYEGAGSEAGEGTPNSFCDTQSPSALRASPLVNKGNSRLPKKDTIQKSFVGEEFIPSKISWD